MSFFRAVFALLLCTNLALAQGAGNQRYTILSSGSFPASGANLADLWFSKNKYFIPGSGAVANTRTGPEECVDASGNWSQAATTQSCITNLGVSNWEARTNSPRNNTMQGAVAGSPGTPPTNWAINGVPTGVSYTINSVGIQNGVNVISITFTGTNTSGGNAFIAIMFEAVNSIPASYGQTWSISDFLQTSGLTQVGWGLRVEEINSSGTFLTQSGNLALGTPATFTRESGSYTLVSPTVAFVTAFTGNAVLANGASIAQTLIIGWPQLELNPNITSSVASATVNAGGTLYTPSSSGSVTWSGTGCTTNPVLNVTTSVGGVINAVTSVATAGVCGASTFPSSSATTWTDGTGLGTGSGASFNLTPTNNAAQAFATAPILTTTVAVTRPADKISLTVPTCNAGGSILAVATPVSPTTYTPFEFPASLDDGTTANRITLNRDAGIYFFQEIAAAGPNGGVIPSGTWAANTQAKFAGAAPPNLILSVANNTASARQTATGFVPGLTTLRIGNGNTAANNFNGVISRVEAGCGSPGLINN